MTEKEADNLRHLAHAIIIKLYDDKKRVALDLLMSHCKRAIEEIDKTKQTTNPAA